MSNPIVSLVAPVVVPDPTSAAYRAARQVLEDHPGTSGIAPMALSSLAQQLVDTMETHWLSGDTAAEQRDEAYQGLRGLLERRAPRPACVEAAIPDWVRKKYAENLAREAEASAPGTPLPLDGAA
jgi:hypothetical protein